VKQRQQSVDSLAIAVAERGLDRQVELLEERDLLVERVAQAHAPARVDLAGEEAKAPEGARVEPERGLLGACGHRLSVERAPPGQLPPGRERAGASRSP